MLRKLKEAAESYLGHKVNKAVITVPAYFNDAQRQATKDAGQIAGLEVARIINEPTAAAMAYGLDKKKDEKIVVFDLGGGTFDVSVLEVADQVTIRRRQAARVAVRGDQHQRRHALGRRRLRRSLINYVADEFKREHGIDLRKDPMALQRLQEACEKAKKELSSLPQTDINLPFITADASGPKHLQITITRSKFEELVDDLIERCRGPVQQAMQGRQALARATSTKSCWSAVRRACPRSKQLVREIFGKEPHKGVNPDEVVAVGAAIQGSVLAGDRRDVLLLDVTPLTLGIETEGGVMTPLVERNTTIPAEKKKVFSTAADNQTGVTVKVFQGERQDGQRQPAAGRVQPGGNSAGAARRAADRSQVRHRPERHSERQRQGPGHRTRRRPSGSNSRRVCPKTRSSACGRTPNRMPRKTSDKSNWSRPAIRPTRCAISWRS